MRISAIFRRAAPISVAAILSTAVFAGTVPGAGALAQQAGPTAWHIEKINRADDAYFKAAIAIETAGGSPERLAALKKADDRYFEAVMAFEAAQREAVQIARVEAADDAYFKAAMALEESRKQARQLAQLKQHEQMMAQREADDQLVTASAPGAKDAIEKNLAKVKAADDAYFDAVIAIETSGENPDDLKKLKQADDAYFAAVIALEDAYAQQAEAKKTGKADKAVKMAAAQAPMSDAVNVRARAVKAAHAAPVAPTMTYQAKPKVAGATYRGSVTGKGAYSAERDRLGRPLAMLYNMVTFPVRAVAGSRR